MKEIVYVVVQKSIDLYFFFLIGNPFVFVFVLFMFVVLLIITTHFVFTIYFASL